ncbi:MAG: Uncharacterized protein Athens101428_217 [Candidatus Berkelbacteria bacterium Athens1014_28]|uniref:Prepilin-type N-terminal cleavage/methylation domain-containing protein n=1 Tax=Candidatus Berkelbacteria bacterium Athens1014_28 TaxID=2017145 RepID=A0A554LP86_9BACT|nr:MAG: Uncharacterized protein Athens101428_217 [Candidatus Berkelbacteria bacterium Athens1014_28]
MKKAFTLIELILVIAIIGLMGSLTVPMYQSFQVTTIRVTFCNEFIGQLHRVKLKAQSLEYDDSWSIAIGSGQNVTIFKGSDFQNRDQSKDETIKIPTGFSVQAPANEITFSKLYGIPNITGEILIIDSNNHSQAITINSQGTIDY